MLTLPASVRIYVAAEAVDLRWGFDGLAAACHVELDAGELGLLLEGVDLRGAARRARWRRLPAEAPAAAGFARG